MVLYENYLNKCNSLRNYFFFCSAFHLNFVYFLKNDIIYFRSKAIKLKIIYLFLK